MLKQSLKLFTSANNISNFSKCQTYCTVTKDNHKWDLLSAICVERHPIITVPKSKLEEAFQNMLNEIELENSMKSDHELQIEAEIQIKESLKKGLIQVDPDKMSVERAQDIEDKGDAELAAFKFGERITEADLKNIKTSLQRKLDKALVLVVEQKIGNKLFWLPPQGTREEGENMRQAAERILRETCGEKLNIRIYGNAPMGFYKYVYPKSMREKGHFGAKIFYYLGKYMDGEISNTVKYQWLDRQELQESLSKPIYKSVSKFLIPDDSRDQ